MEKKYVFKASDGTEVKLEEVWHFNDETGRSLTEVEVRDNKTNKLICTYRGSFPIGHTNLEAFVKRVEGALKMNYKRPFLMV